MLLIALNLGGASVLALDQQAKNLSSELSGRRKVNGLDRDHVLRTLRVGNDLLFGLTNTAAERRAGTGEGHACNAHEVTPGDILLGIF